MSYEAGVTYSSIVVSLEYVVDVPAAPKSELDQPGLHAAVSSFMASETLHCSPVSVLNLLCRARVSYLFIQSVGPEPARQALQSRMSQSHVTTQHSVSGDSSNHDP